MGSSKKPDIGHILAMTTVGDPILSSDAGDLIQHHDTLTPFSQSQSSGQKSLTFYMPNIEYDYLKGNHMNIYWHGFP